MYGKVCYDDIYCFLLWYTNIQNGEYNNDKQDTAKIMIETETKLKILKLHDLSFLIL